MAVIDRGRVMIDYLDNVGRNDSYKAKFEALCKAVDEAPALDYAPAVHGEWGEYEAPYGFPSLNGFPCSACGMHQTDIRGLYYCPNCGAKMDGGKE